MPLTSPGRSWSASTARMGLANEAFPMASTLRFRNGIPSSNPNQTRRSQRPICESSSASRRPARPDFSISRTLRSSSPAEHATRREMSLLSAIIVAVQSLLVNKGRSSLTSLGIIIGIGAVIALVSAGDGARRKLDERLESVGKNLILIRAGARTQQGIVADYVPLTMEDVAAIRKEAGPLLVGVAPTQMTQRLVSSGSANWLTTISGSTP